MSATVNVTIKIMPVLSATVDVSISPVPCKCILFQLLYPHIDIHIDKILLGLVLYQFWLANILFKLQITKMQIQTKKETTNKRWCTTTNCYTLGLIEFML